MSETDLNITNEELEKLKIIGDYLCFDQYQDKASYPRFEECFGILTQNLSSEALQKIFQDICGTRHKYISFRRLIKAYINFKENKNEFSNETKDFLNKLFSEVIKKEGDSIGNVTEGAIKYTTNKNGKKMYAISKFCVITDENKEKIKGFRIYYDDFFKNDLFLNKSNENIYISLEINLSILENSKKERFPDINSRDGITHIIGTYQDTITFLGFKCRSGKTLFIGSPSGTPFIIGQFKKQIQAIDIQVKDGLLCYFFPYFEEVERVNPHIDKKLFEINQNYINDDKPIFEEEVLSNLKDEDLSHHIFTPLIDDEHFFNPHLNDIISGKAYKYFRPLTQRFALPPKGMPHNKPRENFNEKQILNKAMEFYHKKKEKRGHHHRFGREFGRVPNPPQRRVENKLDMLLKRGDSNEEIKTIDFLLSKENYKDLLSSVGKRIRKGFKGPPPQPENTYFDGMQKHGPGGPESGGFGGPGGKDKFDGFDIENENNNNINSQLIKGDVNKFEVSKDEVKASKKKNTTVQYNQYSRGGNTAYGISNENELQNYFYDIQNSSSNKSSYNNNYYDNNTPYNPYGNYSTTYADYYNNTANNRTNTNIYITSYNNTSQNSVVTFNTYSSYEDYLNSYLNNYDDYNNMIDITPSKPTTTTTTQKLTKKQIAELTKKAQANWKNVSEKYSKASGIYIIKTIGAVIKAISFLKAAQNGDTSKYTMQEQIEMYEVLQSNADIISMLSKAHEESLRREAEAKQLEADKEKLALMKAEEEKRKNEEKNRLEEEQRRIQEQKEKELQIQQEEDERKRAELEKEEEERRKREEEEKQKLIEEERQKAEEESNAQKEKEEKEQKTYTLEDLQNINQTIEMVKQYLNKAKDSEKTALNEYYNELLSEQNDIIEYLNKVHKEEMKKELNYDAEAALKEEEEQRKKLMEEENKKIEELNKQEEEKVKEQTQYISINEINILDKVKIFKNQELCEKNKVWTDELFQPLKKNLCPVDSYGRWSFPEGIESSDVEGWEKITWERADNIFNSKNYQVFYDGIIADDIIQGGLGDCYFLSAIAALCKFPKLIEKLFYFKEKSQEHCYGCYYKIGGVWELVLVDDYIPCYGTYGKNPAFTSTNGNELWVILLEKAWAKLNGNYAKAIGGEPHEVFDVITNAWSEKIKIDNSKSNEIWEKLVNSQKKGFIMTAGTSSDTYNLNIEELGLVPGHAYTCLEVYEVTTKSGKVKLIHLRNPWGNGEWSGDWCDSSRKWTDDIRKQCGKSNKQEDNGSFWMSFEHFLTYYTMLGICHLHENYLYQTFHITKEQSKDGPILTEVEVLNDNTHIYFMLHQKNPRIILDDGTYQKPVIIYLMLVDSDSNFINSNSTGTMNCSIEVNLNKGTYYIVSDANFRYIEGGKMNGYNLSAYSSTEVKFSFNDNKKVGEVFKDGLYSFTKSKLQSQDFAGGKLYQSKSCDEFPFNFILFDNNKGTYDVTLTDSLVFRGNKCASFYLESGSENAISLSKTITPDTWDVFVHMPWSYGSVYSYELKTSARQSSSKSSNTNKNTSTNNTNQTNSSSSSDDIVSAVFAEQGQVLDNQGYIKQYLHQSGNGYYIGLENGSKRNLDMKLMMEGLYEVNNPNASTVTFTINSMTRRVFSVKVKTNYRGNITYMFDYA